MMQREVQGDDKVTWTCVQAFTGTSGPAAMEAAKRAENAEGTVPVICTPSGGKQSVRLELSKDWVEKLSEEDLLSAISAAE